MYARIVNDAGCEINVTDNFDTGRELAEIIKDLVFEPGDKIIIEG